MESTWRCPNLETERLTMRRVAEQDTDFLFRHFSNPSVTQYLLDQPPLKERTEAEEIVSFYNNPNQTTCNRWVLASKHDQQVVGTCGFHKWDKRYDRAEIGYDLAPDAWGQGLMSEALRAALEYGFETMGLNRVDALAYVENDRSVKLLEKMGFKNEGLLRDYFSLNGIFYDHYIFSLLKREWKAMPATAQLAS